jgi:hypothetical protein
LATLVLMHQRYTSSKFNLIFMDCFQVNRATYKIQTTSYCVEEGERVGRTSAVVEVGAEKEWACSVETGGGRGSGRQGTGVDPAAVGEAVGVVDTEEARARDMDLTTVREVVGVVWRQSRSGHVSSEEMIVARVRI